MQKQNLWRRANIDQSQVGEYGRAPRDCYKGDGLKQEDNIEYLELKLQ